MALRFDTAARRIGARWVVRLPQEISEQLPSRGLVMAEGAVNGQPFTLPLEPDGQGGHWLEVPEALMQAAGAREGEPLSVTLSPAEDWPEPDMPADMLAGIAQAGLSDVWDSLTTRARWEWLRWMRATNNAATREKRIGVAADKLRKGMRRPCCFNAASCTVPDISKGGVLKE